MKSYRVKTSFVSPKRPKSWVIKNGFNFLVLLTTGSNSVDINRLRSNTLVPLEVQQIQNNIKINVKQYFIILKLLYFKVISFIFILKFL